MLDFVVRHWVPANETPNARAFKVLNSIEVCQTSKRVRHVHLSVAKHRVICLKPYSCGDRLDKLIVEAEDVVKILFKHLIDIAAEVVCRPVVSFFVFVSLSEPCRVGYRRHPVESIGIVR